MEVRCGANQYQARKASSRRFARPPLAGQASALPSLSSSGKTKTSFFARRVLDIGKKIRLVGRGIWGRGVEGGDAGFCSSTPMRLFDGGEIRGSSSS